MNGIYLGLGGNKGDRSFFLLKARDLIGKKIGTIIKESSIYQTAAWGNTKQQDFYNQVVLVKSSLSAQECLKKCLAIELELGRARTDKWSSRTIDLDILFFGNKIVKSKNLQIPHPFLHERNFVLIPMNEISPYFVHPVFRKRMKTLLKYSQDNLPVKKVSRPS
jgi:2-amino-4-hydroxy-6-hydroxymethyldihydropteridine diphosphokinase